MTNKAKQITAMYEKEISNLEWHLETNLEFFSTDEIKSIQLRIQDRKEFLRYLTQL